MLATSINNFFCMKSSHKLFVGLVVVVLVGVGIWWAFSAQSGSGLANLSANTKLTDTQVQQVVANISKFLAVPSDEKPSVVVLSDVQSLAAQQQFYQGAKDGDLLVLYSNRAIIYDAAANKLVAVGPIQRNDATPSPTASGSAQFSPSPSVSASPAVPEKVTVDVRNGTTTAGLAGSMASTLKKNTWVTIGAVGDAKGSYTKTTLVDLSGGKKPNAVAALEGILKVTAVTALPKGESTSTADILVIVGK
jgi:hypothetical protein